MEFHILCTAPSPDPGCSQSQVKPEMGKELTRTERKCILEECAWVTDMWLSEKRQKQGPGQKDWVVKMA